MEDSIKEILRGAILSVYLGLVAILIILGLFFFKAIETDLFLQKSQFYFGIGGVILIALIGGITTISVLVKMGKLKSDFWLIFNLFIHDPEEDSIFAGTPIVKYLKLSNIIHFSIIFGLSIALFSTITQTFFVSLPSTEFQVTETGKVILGTEPASSIETIILIFYLGLTFGLLRYLIKKYDLPDSFRYISFIFIPILGALFWVAMHFARYGAEQTNLLASAFFGFAGSLLSIITGSIIPWYVWHFFNNMFGKISEIFSNEVALPIIIFLLITYVSILIIYKLVKRKGVPS